MATALTAWAAGFSSAAEPPDSGDVDALIARELADLRTEIDRVRRGDDGWLDAQRSAEMKALVADVLADTSARASLQGSLSGGGLTAGYDGKAFIASADGSSLLRIHGFMQTRYTINHRQSQPADEDAWTKGFEVRRVRLFLDGRIHDVGYRIRFTAGATGEFSLDQAYADLALADTGYTLRLGQLYLPLFRDDFVNADGQLAVDSSVVNQVFNPGNSKAIQLQRAWENVRFWLAWSDGLRSSNRPWDDPRNADYAITGRVEVRGGGGEWSRYDTYTSFPGEDLGWMVGFAAHWSGGANQENDNPVDLAYFTLDGTIEGDGWNVAAMGVLAYDNLELDAGRAIDSGFLVQGGLFIAPRTELFTRFDMLLASDDRPDATDPFQAITVGVNWYLIPGTQRVKLTANIVYFPESTTDTLIDALGGNFASQGLLRSDSGNQWAFQSQLQVQF